MKKIKESKMIYESIKIPENLEYKVNNALRTNKNKSRFYINRVVTVCSSVCLLFILLLNVNPSFANTVNDIPVIGKITSIFTIREYFKEDDSEIINVKEPAIITNNKDVEEKINNIIANKIKDLEKESELSVDEIKKEINYKAQILMKEVVQTYLLESELQNVYILHPHIFLLMPNIHR